jgi:hypothetical protein
LISIRNAAKNLAFIVVLVRKLFINKLFVNAFASLSLNLPYQISKILEIRTPEMPFPALWALNN